jgi:hypothetical protein
MEFRAWPKIKRGDLLEVTITEKIDGTNGCIQIEDGEIVGIQSRKRMITPTDDNYGFAHWVYENREDILVLGDGYHYGEWAGPTIQKNHIGMTHRQFLLFDINRYERIPECCCLVPELYTGKLHEGMVEHYLAQVADHNGEGIVIYHHATGTRRKYTVNYKDGKWKK